MDGGDDAGGPARSTGSSVTRKPGRAAASGRVQGEVGDDAVDRGRPAGRPGPSGSPARAPRRCRPRAGSERELARAAAKRWCPSAMTAPVPPEGRGEPGEQRPGRSPATAGGRRRRSPAAPASARRGRAAAVSSATVRLGVVGQHDRLEVGAGRGQQRAPALDRDRVGVLVRQDRRRSRRREARRRRASRRSPARRRAAAARRARGPARRRGRGRPSSCQPAQRRGGLLRPGPRRTASCRRRRVDAGKDETDDVVRVGVGQSVPAGGRHQVVGWRTHPGEMLRGRAAGRSAPGRAGPRAPSPTTAVGSPATWARQ